MRKATTARVYRVYARTLALRTYIYIHVSIYSRERDGIVFKTAGGSTAPAGLSRLLFDPLSLALRSTETPCVSRASLSCDVYFCRASNAQFQSVAEVYYNENRNGETSSGSKTISIREMSFEKRMKKLRNELKILARMQKVFAYTSHVNRAY